MTARHNLGVYEHKAGNVDKTMKHFVIAAGCGHAKALKHIRSLFMNGNATRDNYEEALRAYQQYAEEVRSDQRDKAAAFRENYKYLIEYDP